MAKKKINYGETIRARVSKADKDFIQQYTKEKKTDFSKLLRNFINTLRTNGGN